MKFHIIRHLTITGWQYRWVLKSTNGNKIGISGESYRNRLDCEAMVAQIRKNAAYAKVER